MKTQKKILLSAIFLGALTMTSCKKKYSCVCQSNMGIGADQTYTVRADNQTDAAQECVDKSDATYSCQLQ